MFNINGYYWHIKLVSSNHPKLQKYDGTYALGSCDGDTQTIYISLNVPTEKFKKVMCHEITHAAMFSYNVFLNEDQEELIADLIATYGQEIINVTNRIFSRIQVKGED